MFSVCLLATDVRQFAFAPLEFEHPSALLLRHPLRGLSEANWNVELNHVCQIGTPCSTFLAELVSHCATGSISPKAYIGEAANSWEAKQILLLG